jgi:hypothetical protein
LKEKAFLSLKVSNREFEFQKVGEIIIIQFASISMSKRDFDRKRDFFGVIQVASFLVNSG